MNNFETARQSFLEGLQHFEANNLQAAEMKFTHALELIPDRVSTLNNLSVVKIRQGKFTEAEELARRATSLEKSAEAWSNLGIILTETGRFDEALEAQNHALECNCLYPKAWLNKAKTLLKLNRFEEGLEACEQALKLDPTQHEAFHTKSLLLKELQRPDEARKTYLKSFEVRTVASPVVVTERHTSQKGEILIASHNPVMDDTFKSFDKSHLDCPNFPGQLASEFREDFHFTFVSEGIAMRPSSRKQVPQPDAILNNCTNGALIYENGNLHELGEFLESFGVPIMNHPGKAMTTTRDESVKLLEGIPGVLAPKTARFYGKGKSAQILAREIESQFQYPIITRTLVAQEGRGMAKVDSRDALIAELSSGPRDEFFVTQFVETRNGEPFYRKLRAAVVESTIVIVRVDYDSYWNVHGRKSEKRVPFYQANMYLLDEEKRICKDPETALGKSAVQALGEIRNRIPLDVFGIDFGVDANGSVVFYEANATMNLLPTAQKQLPNPKEQNEFLKETLRKYLCSLVSGKGRN